jgi:hypothetical protein
MSAVGPTTTKGGRIVPVKGKSTMGLVVAALIGSAGLSAPLTANAATPACGLTCTTWFNKQFGNGYVMAVSGDSAKKGTPVILSSAADSATEDWILTDKGSLPQLYTEGLVTSVMATAFPGESGYEIEYSPGGIKSGLCVGLDSRARNGARVDLRDCGVNWKTIWVVDQNDANGRSVPLVPGSNDSLTAPIVLTGAATGEELTTSLLSISSGIIDTEQMWQIIFGPLS